MLSDRRALRFAAPLAAALLVRCSPEPLVRRDAAPDQRATDATSADSADVTLPPADVSTIDARAMDSGVDAQPADVQELVDRLDPRDSTIGSEIPPDASAPMDVGCPSGTASCGGSCVDTRTDSAHCGACDRACAAGLVCVDGACSGDATWSTNATANDCSLPGVIGSRITYRCPPSGAAGNVWGTGVYTHDSSVCTAAVHAGRITAAAGGTITVEMRAGQDSYVGSMRSGVSSSSYGVWRCSFAVVAPTCAAPATSCGDVCADVATDALHCGRCGAPCAGSCSMGVCGCPSGQRSCSGTCVDVASNAAHCGDCGRACAMGQTCVAGVCGPPPSTWSTNALAFDCSAPGIIGSSHTFRCPPMGTAGSVWGTDVYTHDSSVCTAAVHRGRITFASGGDVTITMAPGASSYTGSTRNGVTSSSYGTWSCSYTVP
ncbi:MAG: hypothetical protein JNK05_38295 [Myxococcales bacterium]|nr:hypothetical protein [Myxococcales bacterium]